MIITYKSLRGNYLSKTLSCSIIFIFLSTSVISPTIGLAQSIPQTTLNLPVPGAMLSISPGFTPPLIKGLTIHPENALEFDFIVYHGDDSLQGKSLEKESLKLIKYFMASLTTPEEEMWVNLSPYEKDRIIPEAFGQTEMGRDLLAQDYLLKQLTASLMYPEDELGKVFWKNVYEKAYERFGTTEIPINTFNKVWIVPDKAVVYEHEGTALIVDQHLKVMLEEDYLAMAENNISAGAGLEPIPTNNNFQMPTLEGRHADQNIGTKIIREILIPEIEREVNEGKNFANLRQIYNSMILAVWYKKNLKESLLGQVYVDQNKVKGVDVEDKEVKQKIYQQYLEAFKKGVYNYIKEDYDPATKEIVPRKYFSGGTKGLDPDILVTETDIVGSPIADQIRSVSSAITGKDYSVVDTKLGENQEETDLIVAGLNKQKIAYSTVDEKVAYPRPPIKFNKYGKIYPFWRMVNGLVEILLEEQQQGKDKVILNHREKLRLAMEFYDRFGFENIENGDGINFQEIFDYLEGFGFLQRESNVYSVIGSKEDMITWSRENVLVENDLKTVFIGGKLKEDAIEEKIRDYQKASEKNQLSLVEPYQTFLRGILGLNAGYRYQIIQYLKKKYFMGETAPYTGGTMIDSIMLMFHQIDDLPRWAKTVFPELTKKGRRVYLMAPEITLLAGGLGRVMQYLGRTLKHMGVDVVFLEPEYIKKIVFDKKTGVEKEPEALDYQSLPIPLDIPTNPQYIYSTIIQGQEEEVWAKESINDEGIPVYTFRDARGFITQALYRDGDGSKYPTKMALVEFISKGARGLIKILEQERKNDLESKGKDWKPPFIAANDGQILLANTLTLFNSDYQDDISLQTYYGATNHTVLNTITDISREDLLRAGVPENWLWILKRKSVWDDGEVYDITKGGLLATLLLGGDINSVAENHGDDMRKWIPQNFGDLRGLTNGDLISLTMREFGRTFVESDYGTDEIKKRLLALDNELQGSEVSKRAAIQRKIDEFLYQIVWVYVDFPERTRADLKEMLKVIKFSLKKKYIERYIIPNKNELNINIPEKYKNNEQGYWDEFAKLVWDGYDGRWVWEKDGRERAFSNDNLRNKIKNLKIASFSLANPQYYDGTNEKGGSLYKANEALEVARGLNSGEEVAKYVFRKGFDLNEQLLFLMAVDVPTLDSETIRTKRGALRTGASESTETHAMGFNFSPPEDHGFIPGIGTPLNWESGRGTNVVPQDANPVSYAKAYQRIAESKADGSFWDHMVDALMMFRSVDVTLTAAAYARSWNKSIRQTGIWRKELVKKSGKNFRSTMLDYINKFSRKEGEVQIQDVFAVTDEFGGQVEYFADKSNGKVVIYLPPSKLQKNSLSLHVSVDSRGIPPDLIGAEIRDEYNRVRKMQRISGDEGGGRVEFSIDFSQIREQQTLKGDRVYEISVSGGSWYETKNVRFRSQVPPWIRKELQQESDKKFKIQVVSQGRSLIEGDQVLNIQRGAEVAIDLQVPLRELRLMEHLTVGVYTNTEDGLWRFLDASEYAIESTRVQGGTIKWRIKLNPKTTGELTFALFDRADPREVKTVISWAADKGQNIKVNIIRPQRSTPAFSSTQASSGVTTLDQKTPGGIDFNSDLLDLQVKRDGNGIPLPILQQPIENMNIEGFLPVIINISPVQNLPLLLGIADSERVPEVSYNFPKDPMEMRKKIKLGAKILYT